MVPKTSNNKEDKPPPPNAFLAVQVQSPEIHQRLVDVAGKILDYDASLAWALEPVVKSHITLLGLFLFLPTVLRIRDVYPGSECFPSQIADPHQIIKYFNPKKLVSKLLEMWSGLFIPDPDPVFLPIPDLGVKKVPDLGSRIRIWEMFEYELNFVCCALVAHIEDEEVGGAAAVLEQYVQQTLLPQGLPIHIDFQVPASFKLSSSSVDPHWI